VLKRFVNFSRTENINATAEGKESNFLSDGGYFAVTATFAVRNHSLHLVVYGATLQRQELLTPATATPAFAGDPGCAPAFGRMVVF